ncbi:MAG: response regulator [Dissulfurispiraceae bacterium]|jgi:CheY-like chemotaxis protein
MAKNKNILIVEDEGIIALQLKGALERMGHTVAAIYTSGEKALEGIEKVRPDMVLMDIKLQGKMDGIETADIINKRYDIPIIYMTAHSEESMIERAKITEPYGYLLKPVNSKELQIAIEVTLYKSKIDKEKAQLTQELRNALEKVKLLSGMLPICASCKKIRDDKGYWNQIETYISEHSEALFSHAICPDCGEKLYPEYYKDVWGKKHK